MGPNRAKAKLVNGELALNGFFYLPDPITVELMGLAGYDAVSMDLQHMAWGLDRVRKLIMTAELAGVAPIVRIAPGDWGTALKVLDAGAQGIMVSHVHSLDVAKAAVDAVRYAPLGDRGAHSYTRASAYGTLEYKEHTRTSNEQVLLILTIEDAPGLDVVEDIAALEGVDVLTFGPHDLAESMGIRDPGDARVRDAIVRAVGQVRDVGGARFGLPIGYPRLKFTIQELIELGASWGSVMPTPEALMLRAMKEAVGAVREGEAVARAAAA
jgi:2-keto-3-deoxy-L-rhamnonate aldolase RhmA